MKIDVRKRAAELLKKHYSTEEGNLDEIRKYVTEHVKVDFYGEFLDEVIEEALGDFKRVDSATLHIMNLYPFNAGRDPYLWVQENEDCTFMRDIMKQLKGEEWSVIVRSAFDMYIKDIYFSVLYFLSEPEKGAR